MPLGGSQSLSEAISLFLHILTRLNQNKSCISFLRRNNQMDLNAYILFSLVFATVFMLFEENKSWFKCTTHLFFYSLYFYLFFVTIKHIKEHGFLWTNMIFLLIVVISFSLSIYREHKTPPR
nr:MAG TPA: hypothetical protein [Caudoviricetes sp.]